MITGMCLTCQEPTEQTDAQYCKPCRAERIQARECDPRQREVMKQVMKQRLASVFKGQRHRYSDDTCRQVVALYNNNMPISHIAKQLGMKDATVANLLARAKIKLGLEVEPRPPRKPRAFDASQ
jgi:hypothetical protein